MLSPDRSLDVSLGKARLSPTRFGILQSSWPSSKAVHGMSRAAHGHARLVVSSGLLFSAWANPAQEAFVSRRADFNGRLVRKRPRRESVSPGCVREDSPGLAQSRELPGGESLSMYETIRATTVMYAMKSESLMVSPPSL